MSSWHNRFRRRQSKAKQLAKRRYVFSDGTVILDDQQAVIRKMASCGYQLSYRMERINS